MSTIEAQRQWAQTLLDQEKARDPRVLGLARFLSPAVFIEPELIRAIRVKVLPAFDVGVEADLWFGRLVRSRGVDGIRFHQSVIEELRGQLKKQWDQGSVSLRQCIRDAQHITERVHENLSPALALEERLSWLSIYEDQESIENELGKVAVAITGQDRPGLLRWWANAWGRLPESVRESRSGWLLCHAASTNMGARRLSVAKAPDGLHEINLKPFLSRVPDEKMGVRRKGPLLELGEIEGKGAAAIMLPDTDPRLVEVSFRVQTNLKRQSIAVPRGESVQLTVGYGLVELRTARDVLYRLARSDQEGQKKSTGYRALVISTFEDLKDHRAHVIQQLRRAGFYVDPREDWTADSAGPKQLSLERLDGCDVCILLVAFQRGYVPEGETRSITQLEYEAALGKGVDIFPFLLEENTAWPRKFDDLDKDPELKKWREQLLQNHVVEFFAYVPYSIDLTGVLGRWLGKWKTGQPEPREPINWPDPKSPYPGLEWFDAEYAPVFFGRDREVDELIAKMSEPRGRFLLISGAAGSGKSSLIAAGLWKAIMKDGRLPGSTNRSAASLYRALVISTFEDLKDHRAHVIQQLRRAGFYVDPREDWTANSAGPKQLSLERLDGCDVCILLVAFQRGYVPEGETRSITQLEYEAALGKGVDIFPFLLEENTAWPRKFDDLDKDPELKKWREQITKRHVVEFFSLEPRSINLSGTTGGWLQSRGGRSEPKWVWLRITPGDGKGPFDSLAWGLKDKFPQISFKRGELDDELARHPSMLKTLLASHLTSDQEFVLFVDQLEELFTQAFTEEDIQHFLEQLIATTRDPQDRVRVVTAVQSDFIGRLVEGPFHQLLNSGYLYNLAPISLQSLQEIIEKPAKATGYYFEPQLVKRILNDAGKEPGNLSLIGYTLNQLFRRRQGQTFTLEAYQEMGGLLGAIGTRADRVMKALGKEANASFDQVFAELVSIGQDQSPARKRVPLEVFQYDSGAMELIQALAGPECGILDIANDGQETTVKVSYENLFTAWPRLRNWLDENREIISVLETATEKKKSRRQKRAEIDKESNAGFAYDIYLSHSSHDSEKAMTIAEGFRACGWSVFQNLQKGPEASSVYEKMNDALSNSRIIVVGWSNHSIHSPYVKIETEKGLERNVLFSLLIEDVIIPSNFADLPAADLIGWEGDQQDDKWKRVVHDLENFLGQSLIKTKGKKQGIFISYRREDSGRVRRLYNRLTDKFGKKRIFMDIDTIEPGLDFIEQIEHAVQSCNVLIAVIGETWVNIIDEHGHRRLDNRKDFIRVEIQAALKRNIPVIPLLVEEASMPKASDLPESLQKLTRYHAMKMSDKGFHADANGLIEQIQRYVTDDSVEGSAKLEVPEPIVAAVRPEAELPPPRLEDIFSRDPSISLPAAERLPADGSMDIAAFVSMLRGLNPVTTFAARTYLARVPEQSAPMMVAHVLNAHKDWHAATLIPECFDLAHRPFCEDQLVKAVKNSGQPDVVRKAIESLGFLGASDWSWTLFEQLEKSSDYFFEKLEFYVVLAIARMFQLYPEDSTSHQFYVSQLETLFSRLERTIRLLAERGWRSTTFSSLMDVLALCPSDRADFFLKKWLNSDHPDLRRLAARTLGQIRLRRTVPHLLDRIEDSDSRHEVLMALGNIGGAEAVGALREIIVHEGPTGAAGNALSVATETVEDPAELESIADLLIDSNVSEECFVYRGMGINGDPRFEERLRRALTHRDGTIRGHSSLALARITGSTEIKRLRELHREAGSPMERCLIATALLVAGLPEIDGALLDGFRSDLAVESYLYKRMTCDDFVTVLRACPSEKARRTADAWSRVYATRPDY